MIRLESYEFINEEGLILKKIPKLNKNDSFCLLLKEIVMNKNKSYLLHMINLEQNITMRQLSIKTKIDYHTVRDELV